MSKPHGTSTGHAHSEAAWLDTHFLSARSEYQESLRFVGIEAGWKVLDAGCGGGSFLPLLCDEVGSSGAVTALDLAPENVARIDALVRDGQLPVQCQARVGSITDLPFESSTFDCAWSANVVEYLTEAQFDRAMAELKRVVRPGGVIATKDFDDTLVQLLPMEPGIVSRFFEMRRKKAQSDGLLGTTCGISLPSRLRRAGLENIRRRSWLVERWSPVPLSTRQYAEAGLSYWSELAAKLGAPEADLRVWREFATHPAALIDDPDFCFREGFVVATGRIA